MRRLLLTLTLLLAACAKNIPNTEIRDTPDTRAILDVIEKYRVATERRDAAVVLSLVSTSYFQRGMFDAADDLDYAQLQKALAADFQKLPSVRIELGVRQIEVDGDKAKVTLLYESRYRVTTPSGEVPRQRSDESQMAFRKENGAWKITSGL